jgi:hypothetical protein
MGVVMTQSRDFFAGPFALSPSTTWPLVLSNFSNARVGAHCDSILVTPPSVALPQTASPAGTLGAAVCIETASGYWHIAGMAASAPAAHRIDVWKFSHGGKMLSVPAPRTNGAADGGASYIKLLHQYSDYHVADLTGSGAPQPVACNVTSVQPSEPSPSCVVLPAEAQINTTFQSPAPSLKSTNIDLWQAWHLNFVPQLAGGGWGGYDSADLTQARYMFDELTSLGFSFYISDNTNGLGADFGNTMDATRQLAMFSAQYNAEKRASGGKIHFALSVGVNPLGGATDPNTLPKMEAQLESVWQTFLNTSTETGAKAAAAAYRHPADNKPLVVLYVEPIFEKLYEAYMQAHPEKTPFSARFHRGYSNGNNDRAGLYGWMINRTCGPPNTPEEPCSTKADVGVRKDADTMYISPAYSGLQDSGQFVYAARSLEWYKSLFPVAASACPSQLIVGGFNDYTEMNCWWPSQCPSCRTGEESDPRAFWDATAAGLRMVRQACA